MLRQARVHRSFPRPSGISKCSAEHSDFVSFTLHSTAVTPDDSTDDSFAPKYVPSVVSVHQTILISL
jgi:hypothetical protein